MKNFIRLKQWSIYLWNIDPGYFQLKQAAKTVLAILITLFILRSEPFLTKIIGGLVCGFSMQGIIARTFSARLIQGLFFYSLYFSTVILGLLVRDLPNLKSITLVLLGFGVNYIRRFNLQTSIAPTMAWILCFLATILPLDTRSAITVNLYGLAIGLIVSVLVLFIVFPENYLRLFVYNSNRLFHLLSLGLLDIERYLLAKGSIRRFDEKKFNQLKVNLNYLLDSNQAIQKNMNAAKYQDKITQLLTHQYGLVQAYVLMLEAYRVLKIQGYALTNNTRSALGTINKQFSDVLHSLTLSSELAINSPTKMIPLTQLTGTFSDENLNKSTIIMAILNLKLSFNLFNQHIYYLQQTHDKT